MAPPNAQEVQQDVCSFLIGQRCNRMYARSWLDKGGKYVANLGFAFVSSCLTWQQTLGIMGVDLLNIQEPAQDLLKVCFTFGSKNCGSGLILTWWDKQCVAPERTPNHISLSWRWNTVHWLDSKHLWFHTLWGTVNANTPRTRFHQLYLKNHH